MAILDGPELDGPTLQRVEWLATMPARLGGLGLQNAARCSPGAFWGAWADGLHMLHQRRPLEAAHITALLNGNVLGSSGCVAAAEAAGQALDRDGLQRPTWDALRAGLRPAQHRREREEGELGEWKDGWQFFACSLRNRNFRERAVLPQSTAPQQALLRSGSGSHAAAWLHTLPTCQGTRMPAELFQTALRRRLRLPLNLHHRTCGHEGRAGCRLPLDMYGDHLAACPRTGLLARRAGPIERAWTRVLREAGARVAHKQLLRDTNVRVRNPQDQRQLDMVAYGITTSGSALCCDATMVSPLQRNGHPIPRAANRGWRGLGARRETQAASLPGACHQYHGQACCAGVRGRRALERSRMPPCRVPGQAEGPQCSSAFAAICPRRLAQSLVGPPLCGLPNGPCLHPLRPGAHIGWTHGRGRPLPGRSPGRCPLEPQPEQVAPSRVKLAAPLLFCQGFSSGTPCVASPS